MEIKTRVERIQLDARTLDERYFRFAWKSEPLPHNLVDAEQPLGLTAYRDFVESIKYPDIKCELIDPGRPAKRYPPAESCIYCGRTAYRIRSELSRTEEHILCEGLGGNLIIPEASCEECQKLTTSIEGSILRTVLWAPRHKLGLKMKKRRRQDGVRCKFRISGSIQTINLPISEQPVFLCFCCYMPPGILNGRPPGLTGIGGMWVKALGYNPGRLHKAGHPEGVTEDFDTLRFSQILAKTAHAYIAAEVGMSKFDPFLADFIRTTVNKNTSIPGAFYCVGGEARDLEPGQGLHEIGYTIAKTDLYGDVFIVRIRLFSSEGAPVYYVVPGRPK